MVEVDQYGHYHRAAACDKPVGSHGHQCITTDDVTRLEKAGWQVTPAPQPECSTCGDTGSFEVDGHDYPCLSCGRGEGMAPETQDKVKTALEEIRLHHKMWQSRRPTGDLHCDLCRAIWPCKTFKLANQALECEHRSPRPVMGPGSPHTYLICQDCRKGLDDRG